MRILFLTPSVRPLGARRSLVELLRALPPAVEALVVCPSEGGIAEELRGLGIPVKTAPHGAWRKLKGRITSLLWQLPVLRGIVREFAPDLIHANEFHIIPQAHHGRTPCNPPVCGHVRLGITPRQIQNYHLRDCARIITVSQAVATLFPPELQERTRVVYNGVNVRNLDRNAAPPAPVLRWREEGRLVAGLLGLVSERKNQLVAAEAVAQANARGGKWGILFAGDAFKGTLPYGEALRERLLAPDLAHCSHWLPFQKDVSGLYAGLDVNLLISSEEGFGRTIIEAGMFSVPSIGSQTGGIPELITAETGWIIPEGDASALAEKLLAIQSDLESRGKMGEAMRQRVRDQFTIEAHAQNMMKVWQEAAESDR